MSSITSKRSLERLGYLDKSHLPGITEKDSPLMLKYVVPNPRRRSPVINRAYYQRTESIRKMVEGWIDHCEQLGVAECAIINLGCGFDPTYFRLATLRKQKQSPHSTKLRYIDIDYPTLITERMYMVRNDDTLFDLLPKNATVDDVGNFVSDTYSCLGIDLRKLSHLERGLESAHVQKSSNGNRCPILVISEVVLAYLNPDESDALIKFFAVYSEVNFILHEQCIPTFDEEDEGENLHPFALTMFRHFEKTMTPLKSLREYRSLYDQLARFERLGWPNCDILNMNLIADEIVVQSPEEHARICSIEPFDEYDEQFWIGAYYFIAVARTSRETSATLTNAATMKEGTTGASLVTSNSPDIFQALNLRPKLSSWNCRSSKFPPEGSYASLAQLSPESPNTATAAFTTYSTVEWTAHNPMAGLEINRKGHTLSILGDEAFIFGGFGLDPEDAMEDQVLFQSRNQQARLGSMVQYNLATGVSRIHPRFDDGPAPRMHHSAATTLDGSAIYMYGGRDGPTKVHNDVWRFTSQRGWDPIWRGKISQEGDTAVPKGLFKHTANMMTIAGRELMVLFGGRLASGEANSQVWAFDLQEGQWGHFEWLSEQDKEQFGGIFSHAAAVSVDANHQDVLLVMGGIRMRGETVLNTVCELTFGIQEPAMEDGQPRPQCWIQAREIKICNHAGEVLKPRFGQTAVALNSDRIWLMGGVSSPGLLQWCETVVEIYPRQGRFRNLKLSCFRELVMVGHATALDHTRQRIVGAGGGGTCFGFGAWWDTSAWGIQL
ncbi:tRNA methyltransferase ppm2 [Podila humilis]|nr:tRNA methyltransferase ppm2 [Podila humilis]